MRAAASSARRMGDYRGGAWWRVMIDGRCACRTLGARSEASIIENVRALPKNGRAYK